VQLGASDEFIFASLLTVYFRRTTPAKFELQFVACFFMSDGMLYYLFDICCII